MKNHFEVMFTEEEHELILDHWTELKKLISTHFWLRAYSDAYSQVIATRLTSPAMGAAVKLVHIGFFVVCSSVPCETGFRDMNIIKTDLRSTMGTGTLNNIMMVFENGPTFGTEEMRDVVKLAVMMWLRRGANRIAYANTVVVGGK